MHEQPECKIYQIGFGLTGVLSLYHYLLDNHVKAVHWDHGNLSRTLFDNLHSRRPLFSGYESYQAYLNLEHMTEDGEIVNAVERHLDEIYAADPSGLFIFNVQPVESLIKTRASLYGYLPGAMRYYNASEEEVFARWRTSYWSQVARVNTLFSGSDRLFVYDISQNTPADLDAFFSQHGFHFCSDRWQEYPEVRGSVDLNLHIRNIREAALYFRYHRSDFKSAIELMEISEKYKPCTAYYRDELKTWKAQAQAGALTEDEVLESNSEMGTPRK